MPFDVLPRHDIRIPPVQFYHPPWQLAQMQVEAAKMRYDAMLKGLDTVLGAVDPVNVANRRLALAKASIEMQTLPLQQEQLQMKINWMRQHPGQPFPSSWGDVKSMYEVEDQTRNRQRYDEAMHPGSGGSNTGTYGTGTPSSAADNAIQQRKDAWDRARARFDPVNEQDLRLETTPPAATPHWPPRAADDTDTDTGQPAAVDTDTGQPPPGPVVSGQTVTAQAEPLSGIPSQDDDEEETA